MNKNTKIRINSLLGIAISAVLLYGLWIQISKQLLQLDDSQWWQGDTTYLIISILLVPLHLGTEMFRWKYLVDTVQNISVNQAWKSYFAGIAISLVTPNRIGEYPGRILYLKRRNTIRLISVSILGGFAQFLTLFLYGIAGLIYYNLVFPGYWQKLVLIISLGIVVLLLLIFIHFEKWIGYFENSKRLKRFRTYGHLMKRFHIKEQLTVLGLSMFRFLVLGLQYLFLLQWMGIPMLSFEGFLLSCLYFWSIAVIPSITFAELGIRGQVSLFLFQPFTQNTIGILTATISLWCINVIIPAAIGSILLIRIRLLR